jgi:hypothetical protein
VEHGVVRFERDHPGEELCEICVATTALESASRLAVRSNLRAVRPELRTESLDFSGEPAESRLGFAGQTFGDLVRALVAIDGGEPPTLLCQALRERDTVGSGVAVSSTAE